MPDSAKVRAILNSVGWFIPPFVGIHTSEALSLEITRSNGTFTQHQLELALSRIYGPDRLAAMVLYKYSEVQVVQEYREIIGESVAAHFLGLGHVSVSGLMPAVEGIGLGLIQQWNLTHPRGVKKMFGVLLDDAKTHATSEKYGVTQEILDVIDGLRHFLDACFFEDSQLYPQSDNTNRHGVVHGVYRDADFGMPINFYKTISAIDILTFISMLRMLKKSGFVPDYTDESKALAETYLSLSRIRLRMGKKSG